jgi:hypothetical protein
MMYRTFGLVVGFTAVSLAGQFAWAQRDAASKIDGAAYEAPYFYDTVGAYQSNAYTHAQVLTSATASGVAVPKAVAKEHTDAIRSNLQAAAKHHASLKQSAKGNAAAAKHLDAIDEHHKKALSLAGEIDAATASGKGDAAKVNKLSSSLSAELKAAQDKHKQVADHLKSDKK